MNNTFSHSIPNKLRIENNNSNLINGNGSNKSTLSSINSRETVSYKWKEDNSSDMYNHTSSSQSSIDKYNNKVNSNAILPKVEKRYDFITGKNYNVLPITQEKNVPQTNPVRKSILLINKDIASHIINENNQLLKKIKALNNYSYNVCYSNSYNTSKNTSMQSLSNTSSLSINSINSLNSNNSLSKSITYNINDINNYNNLNTRSTTTSSTELFFPPIQQMKQIQKYFS
ncbi:hypothetical protein BCR32DRAFT_270615 [Anaeromyces robustus]|uniref:Uncharacterized protein n=1 Tax=Anaeromyces robustus TaxID=1754192 RepID=A0A1Y1WWJ0_9FUNG|nr:hypothetical protein BCR32DRAFT_270615 [Anaeromyces robustus]|eukprot:ORX77494.1 hypothetical protein BCR32DRAFT_270615 [Anaeromyces robustus]